ncbi:MAG: hypothetical protein UX13_C0053G0008 [Candidatus Woesebacteria bacterium GW2011_GWB1_45_5]|uniref:Uncharacterized protein n=1 Tax=Candidatus Woesebacteria bacterium GW2011_GWB1_45_5 TaxID=1618581 RepID=A0A0G1MKR3_9BACT|nr:MAG: hypothetical protein UX13_C0053G0008 [Candidatus Woesebacteria bacterium GW2011_GWB1_45_5]
MLELMRSEFQTIDHVDIEAEQKLRAFEITSRNGLKLIALVVSDNSLFIPLSIDRSIDTDLNDNRLLASEANMSALPVSYFDPEYVQKVCNGMGLPFNGCTQGIYSDGQVMGRLGGIHIYCSGCELEPAGLLVKLRDVGIDLKFEEIEL